MKPAMEVRQLITSTEPVQLDFAGLHVPVHYKPGSTQTLVILFHGALGRDRRPFPFFQPHFPNAFGAHQLSVSDLSLTKDPALKAGWFVGADGIPLQSLLPRMFSEVCAHLDIKRTIYFGASAGGFAALLYSHAHPGSLALVANPQINLTTYLQSPVDQYREACWPGTADQDELAKRVCLNVADLYAASVPNHVCLLNAAGDRFHIYHQTLELASRLPPDARNRVVLHSDYYGIRGHSGSIPHAACVPWLKAAVHAPNWYADAILMKYDQFRRPPAPANIAPAAAGQVALAEDLRLADAIAAWQLQPQP